MTDTFFQDSKLATNPPVKRAAYSDRTAWLMAEISRLVYEEFPTQPGGASVIQAQLEKAGFQVLDYWSEGGTQAILIQRSATEEREGMLVLAFRGTQLKDARDVMVDIKLPLVEFAGGGRVHQGFLDGFNKVKSLIEKSLAAHNKKSQLPLYITGHSLGGALALIATRVFGSDSSGATYTFGCPRAADEAFFAPVKIPVYRVVNAGDGVARMPLGYSLTVLMAVVRLIPVNGTRWLAKIALNYVSGYAHYGSLIFISGDGDNVDVRMSPDIFWQAPYVCLRWLKTFGRALLSDHSMDEYRRKLLDYARKRN